MLCLPDGEESDCSREGRDFDGFSIYNKITSIRDCNIEEGCTDPAALNYDEDANQLDCSCYYDNGGPGCTDINAHNYNPDATSDDGSCLLGTCIVGCMDAAACNHDSSSIVDNGNCLYGNDLLDTVNPIHAAASKSRRETIRKIIIKLYQLQKEKEKVEKIVKI